MSEPRRRYEWEDYLYPPDETGRQVLRNKLGLTDSTEAFNAERRLTALRAAELVARPELVARTFDTAHWKAIHHQVFQDVYEWAGEFRTVDIGKGGHGFVSEDELEHWADEILGQVRQTDMFAGRDRAGVVDGLMSTMQAVNIIHPFREGNGRTQRILTEHIAERAGYLLDWHRISPDAQNLVMTLAFDGELRPLHDALERAVLPIFRGGSVDQSPWPTEPTGPARAPNFWQLNKTGTEVLNDARTQTDSAADGGTSTGSAADPQQQNDLGR
ncbi:Fic family protein [Jatrophihabitans endophyticus]|uniref:Fic/DOC family protein n=1 Tax=Jatrophihabitans endophyticus TaxID=1206085 RepID=UPI0019E96147|nr:Fic family protein [Jatrophihabitans endophyticus]MBE7190552.1 Fic family protein [Jatrophihabitans endophyticus]